ncbi:MAG TPA: hypothetical protein PLD54_01670 [Candidatus Levybacteria bacterium]|nr:hypothetical protein [Candidatus Levybacteria bacterium]
MDNFEGGSPMRNTTSSHTPMVQSQPITLSRSEEIVLSQESEMPVVHEEHNEIVQVKDTEKDVADRLLSDTKEMGIAATFKKLGMGGYRRQTTDKSDREMVEANNNALDTEKTSEEVKEFDSDIETQPSFADRKKEIVA